MKKALFGLVLVLTVLLSTICGCGATDNATAPADGANKGTYETMSEDSITVDGSDVAERKVIITARYSLESDDFAGAMKAIEQATVASGGYMESSEVSGRSENSRANYRLRIPVDKLDSLTAAFEGIGDILSSSREQEDITERYQDVEAKINARTAHRDRLLELITKAGTLTELLQLEEELAQVQGELNSLIGQQKLYDSKITYATVDVTLRQSSAAAITGTSYGKRLSNALKNSFSTTLAVVQFIGVALVALLPLWIIAGIVVVIVLLATRKSRRARRQQKEAMKQLPKN